MSAISENTKFLNAVLASNAQMDNFLDLAAGVESTATERMLLDIIRAQKATINMLANQVVEANDLLHKHHIKPS